MDIDMKAKPIFIFLVVILCIVTYVFVQTLSKIQPGSNLLSVGFAPDEKQVIAKCIDVNSKYVKCYDTYCITESKKVPKSWLEEYCTLLYIESYVLKESPKRAEFLCKFFNVTEISNKCYQDIHA